MKSFAKVFVSSLVLLLLLVGAGVGYAWYSAQQEPVKTLQDPSTLPKVATKKLATKPAPDAPVGVSVQSLTSPIVPGSNASIYIKSNPGAKCSISVEYNKVPVKDSGLTDKVVNEYSSVSWAWTVAANAPIGKWPVKVTCANEKKSGMVIGDLVIVDHLDE